MKRYSKGDVVTLITGEMATIVRGLGAGDYQVKVGGQTFAINDSRIHHSRTAFELEAVARANARQAKPDDPPSASAPTPEQLEAEAKAKEAAAGGAGQTG